MQVYDSQTWSAVGAEGPVPTSGWFKALVRAHAGRGSVADTHVSPRWKHMSRDRDPSQHSP